MSSATPSTAAVVVATYNRPDHVRLCLEHLAAQTRPADEVVVVDSSPDGRTRDVVAGFPGVRYLRNDLGRGHTAASRAIGVGAVGTDVVAFVDDDAYAEPGWLAAILAPYDDPDVAAVGGRALNDQPGEQDVGLDEIGLLRRDGTLSGNFAADPGHDVEVDHLLGANMSVRSSVVAELGGIRDLYPGTCLREETDIQLRMRHAGYRIVFTPAAVVEHVAGQYARGRRFDLRYTYYGQRNHVVLLATTLGWRDPHLRRYAGAAVRDVGHHLGYAGRAIGRGRTGDGSVVRGVGNGLLRSGASVAGSVAGVVAAARASRALARDA
ncbi:MAG TPA: glycosyltransferase family 2 protein [Cellulomonas sp.]